MVTVGWRCNSCKMVAKAFVMERGPDENIVHWIEQEVAPACGTSHELLSPKCPSRKVDILLKVKTRTIRGLARTLLVCQTDRGSICSTSNAPF